MIGAGRLREKIEIERPALVPNGSGGFTSGVPVAILTTYSDVSQHKPSTDLIASQTNIVQVFDFKIRYRVTPVIQIADAIKWRGRNFEILGFDWDVRRSYITITAKTRNESTSNGA